MRRQIRTIRVLEELYRPAYITGVAVLDLRNAGRKRLARLDLGSGYFRDKENQRSK